MSESYKQEHLTTRVGESYDVIVCGAGPAGVGAAITAARRGKKTLLIERYGYAGGMWTAGLVNPLFDNANKTGLLREIIDALKSQNAWGGFDNICFQYEVMKRLLDQLLLDAGVTVLFDTLFVRTIREGKRVNGISVENKEGRTIYEAAIIIDCTGDGDVAVSAGADYYLGRDSDHKTQAMTLMFLIGNIRYEQTDCNQLANLLRTAMQPEDDYQLPYTRPYIIQIPQSNTAVVQLTHMRGLDGTNVRDLTQAYFEGRRQAMDTVAFMKKRIRAFRDIELLQTAPMMGVRESRRIVGDYMLELGDLLSGRQFEDGVALASFNIDIHNPDNDQQNCVQVKPYQIPYRCMLPKGLDGLLVAGRCISGTHEAMSSYRVTGNCLAMGEAAGKAAAAAIETDGDLRRVPASRFV